MKSDSSDVGGRSSRRLAAAVTAEVTDEQLRSMISDEWPMHIRHSASCALYAEGITPDERAQQRKQCAEAFRKKKQADAIRALPCIECHDVIRGGHKTNPCRCHCHGDRP